MESQSYVCPLLPSLSREKSPREKSDQLAVRQPRQGPTDEVQMAAAAALARLEQKQPKARGPTSQDAIRNLGELGAPGLGCGDLAAGKSGHSACCRASPCTLLCLFHLPVRKELQAEVTLPESPETPGSNTVRPSTGGSKQQPAKAD